MTACLKINLLLCEEPSDDEDVPKLNRGHAEANEEGEESEDDEELGKDPDGNGYLQNQKRERSEVAESPPPTPSTVAGLLSDIGLDDSSVPATRASVRRNRDDPDHFRRAREDDEELSDGDGSVYSELSIG